MALCPLPIKSNNYYNDVLQSNKLLLFVVKISILLNDHSVLVMTNFWPSWCQLNIYFHIDYEQSLSFFRFSEGSARASAREHRRREKRGLLPLMSRTFSCLSCLAPSVTRKSYSCLARFARPTKRRERLARSLTSTTTRNNHLLESSVVIFCTHCQVECLVGTGGYCIYSKERCP